MVSDTLSRVTEPDQQTVGVVLIDDHLMFAQSLARVLEDADDITVLAVSEDPDKAVALCGEHSPRVLLTDFAMPTKNGVAVTTEVKRRYPDIMVVMLTGATDDRVLLSALEAGCSGFLTKDNAIDDVVSAVRSVAAGEALISPAMLARLLPRLNKTQRSLGGDLTSREREILTALAEGLSNSAIAAQLQLSVNTVRNYVQGILVKLNAHSKLEAVATAAREGLISFTRPN
jgi:DNA-binding NarL/FixJ family response regulator